MKFEFQIGFWNIVWNKKIPSTDFFIYKIKGFRSRICQYTYSDSQPSDFSFLVASKNIIGEAMSMIKLFFVSQLITNIYYIQLNEKKKMMEM